ncbi:hypothetical protein GCM10008090_05540 [Arenicella chitinivorans]|uniref:Glycosyltransferase 2-like domain-containing protein n=1 Tax=Arenicella chitinivorans TaxID=1329800 RepID=A0A918RIY7_9GAMM|nr:glycosyltransferase family 2 protein [Arenicella chitinivorans]GGZ99782.1 hypothetical protein GCM10008090_05540 [Arenicella chitinivorans]
MSTTTPTSFSVVIPVYNKAASIRRAVVSVLDQADIAPNRVEIILVDDGSQDDSVSCATELQAEFSDRRIKLHRQKNAGVSAARNTGVSLASHPLVVFLDADDSYKPTFLATIERLFLAFPACAAFGTAYEFVWQTSGQKKSPRLRGLDPANRKQILPDFFLSAAQGDLPFNTSSLCVRKDVFELLGGFPLGENMGEDQSLFCELALSHQIAYSPDVCAHYFQEVSGSLMQTESAVGEMPFSERLQSKLDAGTIPADMAPSVRAYIAGHLLDLVRRNLRSGNFAAAKKILKDPRSKVTRLKWYYWHARSLLA